jgi:hypothetical protein
MATLRSEGCCCCCFSNPWLGLPSWTAFATAVLPCRTSSTSSHWPFHAEVLATLRATDVPADGLCAAICEPAVPCAHTRKNTRHAQIALWCILKTPRARVLAASIAWGGENISLLPTVKATDGPYSRGYATSHGPRTTDVTLLTLQELVLVSPSHGPPEAERNLRCIPFHSSLTGCLLIGAPACLAAPGTQGGHGQSAWAPRPTLSLVCVQTYHNALTNTLKGLSWQPTLSMTTQHSLAAYSLTSMCLPG